MTSTPVRFAGTHGTEDPLAPTTRWAEDSDLALVCVGMTQETHDVMSFTFRPEQAERFRFDPGQYLTLTVEVEGSLLSRCYTIASPPTRADAVTITVKRVPDGLVSNWLHDHVGPGSGSRCPVPSDGSRLRRAPQGSTSSSPPAAASRH